MKIFWSLWGTLKAQDLNDAYVQLANALFDGSVDGFIIETTTAVEEAGIEKIHAAGINVVGGCCGIGPGHIRATTDKLKSS